MPTVSRETPRPPRIAIINQKGGVGKTTTAVNLAHGLAIQGKRILLLDMDAQGNATTALGIEKYTTNASTHDFLFGNAGAEAYTKSKYEGLDVYPANVSLIRAELELLRLGDDRDRQLKQRLDSANLPHDFVIIDAPPSLGILTLNILIACDYVLVPVQCEYLALEGLTMLIETIEEIRNNHDVDLSILGCLLTMVDLRTNLSQQIIKDMRTHLGDQVMKTLIPRTVRLSECPSHGKTIFEYERWGPGARAYEALCKEFLERISLARDRKAIMNAGMMQ
ncbi:MAG TPA: ParA family protein [Candidatus Sumerlaeota bacterium]|nr:ParA family protein [Candidatus Sumerlaeota bacterium]